MSSGLFLKTSVEKGVVRGDIYNYVSSRPRDFLALPKDGGNPN